MTTKLWLGSAAWSQSSAQRHDPCSRGFTPAVRPGPMIGQDNERVFKDLLKITAEQYRQLLERQIIF
ncbi:MAG TPA: hypothetical protein VF515_18500 [Candidatus Binatia bacterium]